MSQPTFPDACVGLELHGRLLGQDPTVPGQVCVAFLDPLQAWLGRKFPFVDEHLRQGAVHDALVDYLGHPHQFDPARADLGGFLRLVARRDLLNQLRRERRHQELRLAWILVEDGEDGGNLHGGADDPPLLLVREEESAAARQLIQRVREGCSPEERLVLELMLEGERRTEVYARALGLESRPLEEQEREVKCLKDRLKKRIERGGHPHD